MELVVVWEGDHDEWEEREERLWVMKIKLGLRVSTFLGFEE
jgi:hypothetical protein